jgi:hypothetical protein
LKQLKPGAAGDAARLKPRTVIPSAAEGGETAMTTAEDVIHAARALLKGTISETALGADVMYALRGFRAGLMDKRGFLEAVALGYRRAGAAFKFDGRGNLRKA